MMKSCVRVTASALECDVMSKEWQLVAGFPNL
jgi:hypothetical protein